MNESFTQEEARIDAQDLVQETLQPFRDEYAKECWNDTQLLIDAITEVLNAKPTLATNIRFGSQTFALKINDYFKQCAREQYKTLDDI